MSMEWQTCVLAEAKVGSLRDLRTGSGRLESYHARNPFYGPLCPTKPYPASETAS